MNFSNERCLERGRKNAKLVRLKIRDLGGGATVFSFLPDRFILFFCLLVAFSFIAIAALVINFAGNFPHSVRVSRRSVCHLS